MPRIKQKIERVPVADKNPFSVLITAYPFIIFTALLIIALPTKPVIAQQSPPAFMLAEDENFDRSVIMIRSVSQEFDPRTPWKKNTMTQGVGTGFIIDSQRILTNAHNVSNIRYIEVKKENFARRYPAYVEFIGHDCDLAILKVTQSDFYNDTVPLNFGTLPKVNSTVQTYGFPVGGRRISVTEGVVSRIQVDTYSHSGADSHLVIQTDAAINPGNSGGPVIQDNKVVGVAFQGLRAADNIGYMIPTTVIDHFLKDIQDGTYDGFGSVGFSFYPGLHSEYYSKYLEFPPDKQGVVVTNVMKNSSVQGLILPGDVLTAVDGYDIDNDGTIFIHGMNLHMSEAIEQKQIGDNLEIQLYRQGKKFNINAAIALNRPVLAYWREYDITPRYIIYAGLTFIPLNRNYLQTWGRNWISDMPFSLKYLFADSSYLNKEPDRKEYIVLSSILPDTVNSYSEQYLHQVVRKVNGKKIFQLPDILEALKHSEDGVCEIEFFFDPAPLYIDAQSAEQRQQDILEKYQVPAAYKLEGEL